MEKRKVENQTLGSGKGFALVSVETLSLLFDEVKSLRYELSAIRLTPAKRIYTNKELMELLGIGDKLVKKYRDEGQLGFSQEKDKFWYTQGDVDRFLASHYYPPFKEAC